MVRHAVDNVAAFKEQKPIIVIPANDSHVRAFSWPSHLPPTISLSRSLRHAQAAKVFTSRGLAASWCLTPQTGVVCLRHETSGPNTMQSSVVHPTPPTTPTPPPLCVTITCRGGLIRCVSLDGLRRGSSPQILYSATTDVHWNVGRHLFISRC